MKVLVLIDSFKGSMTSMEAGEAAKAGILRAKPEAEVVVKPLADGGEGTSEALIEGLYGEKIVLTVTGPMGTPVEAYYGILPDEKTAVMEMAQAAGITLVEEGKKDPMAATTYGVGEMILDAVRKGCRKVIVGIGGSATNDGGLGMLKVLGVKFLDNQGREVSQGAKGLEEIAKICLDGIPDEVRQCEFQVACDVTNPLCGKSGATYVYGPQKGVTEELRDRIDAGMAHYAKITARTIRKEEEMTQGAGAAGGLGFAFVSYLHASLTPGIGLVLDAIHFEEALKHADVVVTGEGRLDGQTVNGKAPVGVAERAKKHGCKVIAFSGAVTREACGLNAKGIDAFFPIVRGVSTLSEAMDTERAKENLADTAEQVFRLL